MRQHAFGAFLVLVGVVAAQEASDAPIARVRAGGWLTALRYERGDDGGLRYQAAEGGAAESLLGDDLGVGMSSAGVLGLLALVCHGRDDLLAMTDGAFHLQALGLSTGDADLRQFLATSWTPGSGARGRAEVLDRMVAIDLLRRRQSRGAVVEVELLCKNEALPAMLRERAAVALAELQSRPSPIARRRLVPATLELPIAFDGCLLIDHARLPDLGFLAPLGRRMAALVTVDAIATAGAEPTAEMAASVQRYCDLVAELPFGIAHRFGNARLDHSCLVFQAKAGEIPFSVQWQASGAFEHDLWQHAKLPDGVAANNPLLAGTLEVGADRMFASTDANRGKPRPERAAELLADTGQALRVILPANSKAWIAARAAGLPAATGGEVRVTFGDPGVIELMVEARDEDVADEWVGKGKELLAQGKELLEGEFGQQLRASAELRALAEAVFAADIHRKDTAASAVIRIRGMTPAKLMAIVEQLAQ